MAVQARAEGAALAALEAELAATQAELRSAEAALEALGPGPRPEAEAAAHQARDDAVRLTGRFLTGRGSDEER